MQRDKEVRETTLQQPLNTEAKPTFETLLDTLGHFGFIQRMTFALLTLTDVMNGTIMMYLIFAPATPNWRCAEFEGFNMTDLTSDGNTSFEKTCQYEGAECISFDFDKDYSSISTEWNLVCTSSYIPKLTTSIMMFGVLVGAIVCSQLADLYGRRPTLCGILVMLTACQALVGTSINWKMFAAFRFLVGICLGGSVGLCLVMPMEIIGPKWRTFCGVLGLFDVGHSCVALFAYLLRDWRYLAYTTGGAFLPLVVVIILYVPESVRWLIQKERYKEAEKVIHRMARSNKTDVPDITLLRQIALSGKMAGEAKYTFADLFTTRKYAVRTVVSMFCWFSSACIYYNIMVSLSSLSGDMYLNTVYSAVPNMFISWSIIPVAHWFGRKRAYLFYTSVPVISMFAIVILQALGQMEQQAILRTILALAGKVFISCSWMIMAVISTEMYPTLMRTVGVGIGNTMSRVGGVIAPQIVLLGEVAHWTLPYIINGSLALASIILVLVFLPETHKKPLAEDLPPKPTACWRSKCCKRKQADGVVVGNTTVDL